MKPGYRKLLPLALIGGGGTPWEWATVSGNTPLSLPNALAKPIKSLVEYGKVVQSGTPTMASPQNIYYNYGHDAIVWSGGSEYSPLLGFAFSSATYFQIPIRLEGSDTVRFSASFNKACNVFGSYTTAQADNNFSLYMSTAANAKYLRYNGGTYASRVTSSQYGTRYDIEITPTGSSGLPNDNDSWDEAEFTCSTDMFIGTTASDATSAKFDGNMYGAFEVVDKCYLCPVERKSDGQLGYYDLSNDEFYEPIGSDPVSLGYAGTDYLMETVGDPETIAVTSGGQSTTYSSYPLQAAGDVRDEYDLISGAVVQRVGTYMLTSDPIIETYIADSTYGAAVVLESSSSWGINPDCTPVCTHFVGAPMVTSGSGTQAEGTCFFDEDGQLYFRTSLSVAEFTAWLAQQCAEGNGLILLAPLDVPLTYRESAHQYTPEPGTAVISTNEANISAVPFTAEYAKSTPAE